MTSHPKRFYFDNLDALRFFSFLAVFLYHSFHTDSPAIKADGMYRFVNGLFKHGDLGVNFFFVLSGFLITYLLLKEEQRYGKIDIPKFYMRRVLRIWPLYFAVLAFGFLVFPLLKQLGGQVSHETASPWLMGAFLGNFNNIWNGLPDASMLGVLWSVGIEEQFYLFWPLLMVLFARQRVWVFLGIIGMSVAFRTYYWDNYDMLYFHTLSAISDMAMGGLLAWGIFTYPDTPQRMGYKKWHSLLLYGSVLLVVIFRKDIFSGPVVVVERISFALLFALVIAEQCFIDKPLVGWGRWKALSRLGQYTYGLYCLHFIGILVALQISKRLGTHVHPYQVIFWETALALGCSIGIAYLSYHLYEQPFLRYKRVFER